MLVIAERRKDALGNVWFIVGTHAITPTNTPLEIRSLSLERRLELSFPVLNLAEICTLAEKALPGVSLHHILAYSRPKIGPWRTMMNEICFESIAPEMLAGDYIVPIPESTYTRAVEIVARQHRLSHTEAATLVEAAIQHKGWQLLPLAATKSDQIAKTFGSPDESGILAEMASQELHFP